MSIEEQQFIIKLAIEIIQNNFKRGKKIESAKSVGEQLKILLAKEKEEVFCMLFLDSQHCILSFDTLFRGSINQANVYPRVIVRHALEVNAAAGIMVHNHPSGSGKPSPEDIRLTERIKSALDLIDVRALDHIIVSPEETMSFAEEGLMPS